MARTNFTQPLCDISMSTPFAFGRGESAFCLVVPSTRIPCIFVSCLTWRTYSKMHISGAGAVSTEELYPKSRVIRVPKCCYFLEPTESNKYVASKRSREMVKADRKRMREPRIVVLTAFTIAVLRLETTS